MEAKKNTIWLYAALAASVLVILIVVDGIVKGTGVDWPPFNIFLVCAIVFILFYFVPPIPSFVESIIGETHLTANKPWRFYLTAALLVPFVFYLLLGDQKDANLQRVNVDVIIIAPTLGGLIFAGSGIRQIKRRTRSLLLSVVKKFIIATVLLIMFAPFFSIVNLLGGVDINAVEWSMDGAIRGLSMWLAIVLFYTGVFFFLLALVDLVWALRYLKY